MGSGRPDSEGMSDMARTLRRKSALSRLFTTYLTLVVVVMFTGIAGAVPVSVAEESAPESAVSTATPEPVVEQPEDAPPEEPSVLDAPDEEAAPVEQGDIAPLAAAFSFGAMKISPTLAEPGTGIGVRFFQGYNRWSSWTTGNLGKNYEEGDWVPYRLILRNTGTQDASPLDLIFGLDHFNSGKNAVMFESTSGWGYRIYDSEPVSGDPDTPPAGLIPLSPMPKDAGVQGSAPVIKSTIPTGSFVIPAGKYAIVYFKAKLAMTLQWMPLQGSYGAGGYPGSSGQGYLLMAGGKKTVPLPSVIVPGGDITVFKFFDTDKDGVKDGNETRFLPGWDIHLSNGQTLSTKTTDANGRAFFDYLPPGTYYVSETLKDGWQSNTAQPIAVIVGRGESKTAYIGNFELTPSLAIDKTTTTPSYSAVGDVIHYSYKVTNDGEVTLSAPWAVLDDTVVGVIDVSGAPATLAPGKHFTVTASYSVTQADIDAGFVTNIAYATGTYGKRTVTSPTDSVTVLGVQRPALTLLKKAAPATYDAVGDVITYTYTLTNTGNVTLSGPFSVTDDKATVVPDNPALMALAPGASATFSASYTITQADLDAGSVTNTARGKGFYGDDEVLSNFDDETVTADQRPALTLLKKAAPATYDAVGDEITYTYTLTNSGNVTLSGPFTVEDDKATTSRVGVVPDPDVLAPGDDITFTATYVITQADLDAGSVKNVAQGFGYFGEDKVESNEDDETVAAVPDPKLTLLKKAAPATYDAVGDVITYTYTLTNTGNVTLSGPFSVTDDKATVVPDNPALMALAPGASATFSASYTITQADLDAGSVTNTARGKGFYGDDEVLSNFDDETVTADQRPALTLLKKAAPATYDAVGDEITYTYTLTNSGNVTLSGPFTVEDDKATTSRVGVVPDPDVLAPGDDITFTATYVITQADLDAGSVKNVAQGFGYFGEDKVESNEDDETVAADQNPAIDIVKLTNGEDDLLVATGADVTWSYLVTNTGNVTLSDIVVTDDVIGEIGTIDELAPGEGETLYSYGTAEAGAYENVGTASGTPPMGDDVSDSDDSSYFGASPAIDVEKSVSSALVLEGESVTYTFVVRNTGNVPLYDVTVVDDHLGSIASIPMMEVDKERTFTATAAITEPTTNIVVATGVDGVGQEVSDSDEAFVDIDKPLSFPPDLTIKKSADRTTADPGDVITYTVVVKNIGGEPATDYVVEDTFDQRYLVVVDAAGGTMSNGKITWNFAGPLAFGQTQTITYKLMVVETMPDGRTELDNTAVVILDDDVDTTNNTSTWRVTVDVEEPFLPFTGANLLGLLALAGATGLVGAEMRRRSRRAA